VVSHRDELYNNPQKYNLELQKLEVEAKEKPADPALQFLLGFHYAYLDYPQPAVTQLDIVVKLEPRDEMAAQLVALLVARLPDPAAPVITPGAVTPAIYR
jgi:hypothetical protein